MADFDRSETNTIEIDDLQPDADQALLLTPSIDITQNTTSFTVEGRSLGYMESENCRGKFKSRYNIDDKTFDEILPNLRMIDDILYYKGRDRGGNPVNVLIENMSGGVYALSTIENKVRGTSFAPAIERFELSRLGTRPKVQGQPIEQTVVNRQLITFDNQVFGLSDAQCLDDLRTINADLEAEGEPTLDNVDVNRIVNSEIGEQTVKRVGWINSYSQKHRE